MLHCHTKVCIRDFCVILLIGKISILQITFYSLLQPNFLVLQNFGLLQVCNSCSCLVLLILYRQLGKYLHEENMMIQYITFLLLLFFLFVTVIILCHYVGDK